MFRKWNLDTARFFATILVIAIHTYPFATINADFDFLFTHVFCRIAVPLFLMITGYYVLPKAISNPKYLIEYTKKIIFIYVICIFLYLPINFYKGQFSNMSIFDFIRWIFINGTFYHLWYFPALLFGIWFIYFVLQYKKESFHFMIVFFLYLFGLLGDSYYGIVSIHSSISHIYDFLFSIFDYTRNGLFYMPIFLYLGYYFTKINWKLTKRKHILFLIYFLIILELEGFLLHQFHFQRHDSMYMMLIPVMIFLFPLLLKHNKTSSPQIRSLATLVYIIHPLIIILIRGLAKMIHLEKYFIEQNEIHFLFVTMLSCGISYSLLKLYNIRKKMVSN